MKVFHLIPLLFLTLNFTGKPVPVKPEATASAHAGAAERAFENDDDKVIPWKAQRKLAWDDFLCDPQNEGEAVASTSTSLGLSYQLKEHKLTYRITCDFSKEKSWGALKTAYILAHEQAHFDITEIHARKLYQALYEYETKSEKSKADIAAIYNRIVKEKEAMQHAYDGETDHSRRRNQQIDWLQKIDTMLLETEMFASYP